MQLGGKMIAAKQCCALVNSRNKKERLSLLNLF